MRFASLIAAPLIVGLLPLASAGAAETPITAAEFEAYVTGKTLTYASSGEVWGAEQYRAGRSVTWAFTGQPCQNGTWYDNGNNEICFVYNAEEGPQCWHFFKDSAGLRAQFVGDPEGTPLSEVAQSNAPLICPGPDVGV